MNSTKDEGQGGEISSLMTTLNVVTAILAVFGNGIVISVMLARRRAFSSFSNRLLLNQSIIDATNGLVFFLHRVVKGENLVVSKENNLYDQLVCRLLYLNNLLFFGYVMSSYNLVLISLERYMAICYPVKHQKMMSKRKWQAVAAVLCTVGFIYCLPLMFLTEPSKGRCQFVAINFQIVIDLLAFLIEYFAPLIIMVSAYSAIFIKLRKRNDRLQNFNQAKKNVLVTVIVMSVLFVLCWTPGEYTILSHYFGNDLPELVYVVPLLVGSNMYVNPIMYCFVFKQFRDQLKDVLGRLRRNQVHTELQASTSGSAANPRAVTQNTNITSM